MKSTYLRSIGQQLLFITVISSSLGLLIACVLFIFFDYNSNRESLERNISVIVSIVADNSTLALRNGEKDIVQSNLNSLNAHPSIVQAVIEDKKSAVIAEYNREQSGLAFALRKPEPDGFYYRHGFLHYFSTLRHDGDVIGYIYLRSELGAEDNHTKQLILISLLVLVGALGFAAWISLRLQKRIVDPIHQLAAVATNFSKSGVCSAQLTVDRTDEIGLLMKGFNDMMTMIQLRDRVLDQQIEVKTKEIRRENIFIQAVVDTIPSALLVLDIHELKIMKANKMFRDIFSLQPVGRNVSEVLHEIGLTEQRIASIEKGQLIRSMPEVCQFHESEIKYFEVSLIELPIRDELLLVLDDITSRTIAEQQLHNEKERAQVTLDSLTDAVITLDTEGNVLYLNPIAERYTGWRCKQACGQPVDAIVHLFYSVERKPFGALMDRYLHGGWSRNKEEQNFMFIDQGGRESIIEDSVAPMRDSDGNLIGYVVVLRDVTELKNLIKKISYQASHDELTGLINRREFEVRVEAALANARKDDLEHALLYLDLDQFKIVNDTCGHVAGDKLILRLTAIIKEQIRKNDVLARLGGDEFGVLLEVCPEIKALSIAEGLRKSIVEYQFEWEGHVFNIGVSIGVVVLNKFSKDHANVLSLADAACYAAKDRGRNRVQLYRENDAEFALRYGEMMWVSKLNRAVEEDRLFLAYQNIVPTKPADPHAEPHGEHYEILIRMRDEKGDIVPPNAFLPAAEHYGLMETLDRWVVTKTFEWLATHDDLKKLNCCSINLSGRTINDDKFLDFLVGLFRRHNIAPEKICFEITETAAIANFQSAREFIAAMKIIGCRFALDDFGSGMSSFAYLKNLPVDFLKIDGMFVRNITAEPIDYAMVKSINEVGHVMGMQTIAEFVENDAIRARLVEIGVDFVQGYGIGRPEALTTKSVSNISYLHTRKI